MSDDNGDRVALIRERLTQALSPQELDIVDESHRHIGHAGAQGGGGHFKVWIVSDEFSGKNLLERHRLVYDALGELMNREIHALSVKAHAPDEMAAEP